MSRCHGGFQYLQETPGHGTRLIPVLRQPDGSRPQALPQQGVLLEKKNGLRQHFRIPGSAEIDGSPVLQNFTLPLGSSVLMTGNPCVLAAANELLFRVTPTSKGR